MSSTKQKILSKSLTLFNERGISNVSLRMISGEASISVGNLQYHYKKREEIVEALYFQLVSEIDQIYVLETENLLMAVFNFSVEMIKILYKYRFFLLDFVTITRNNRKIKKHYSELSQNRQTEFLQMMNVLIQHGVFREEILKDEYHNLFKRIEVISNFWFSSELIQADQLSKQSIEEYTLLVNQSIYPYLTDEAKKKYTEMFPEQMLA